MELLAIVYIVGFFLAVALVIAWIVLPFAIIGTKPILRELLAEMRQTNELLRLGRGGGGASADARVGVDAPRGTPGFSKEW
jgi:hypothetical protein